MATLLLVAASCGSRQQAVDQNRPVAYLAAYMKGDDEKSMYYALSQDRFNFVALNGGKPVLTATMDDGLLRDPMILKDRGGVYHLVATVSWKNRPFTMWDSKDLLTWEGERLVDVAPDGASKTWAPEMAYDEENGLYLVYWTAELHDDWSTAAIYYATTSDFTHFSAPKLLYSDDEGILDANILKVDSLYHLTYRKNGIWEVTSPHAQGPYANPRQLTTENVEGPFAFPLNDGTGYAMVWDYFGRSLGYGLCTSADFGQWKRLTNERHPFYNDSVSFPEGIRHGSIIGITQDELQKLLRKYGNDQKKQ